MFQLLQGLKEGRVLSLQFLVFLPKWMRQLFSLVSQNQSYAIFANC
jgi:hypothetical protein